MQCGLGPAFFISQEFICRKRQKGWKIMKKNNIRRIFGITLAAALTAGLAGCGGGTSAPAAAGTTAAGTSAADTSAADTSAEAAETSGGDVKKIVVAHTNYYVPYDFEDENGNSDGYEVAVMKAVDELLPQYEFEFVPTVDDDLLIGVQSGKYDVGTKGVWWTEERSKSYVFPKHYIGASIIGIITRKEDADKFSDLESFAKEGGKLVPIAPQNAQYNIVANFNKSHPDTPIELVAADQFTLADAYQWVREGRYDAYFEIKTSYENNVVNEDGEYHQYADDYAYAAYEGIPTWPLFNSKNQELADAYDEAIEKLEADGTLEKLSEQYFGYSLFDYVPEGYQIGDEL